MKRSEKNKNKKKKLRRWGQKVHNKKINSQNKKPHLKGFPIKTTFDYLHIVVTSVNSRLCLVRSSSQLTFKLESSSYFCLESKGRHIHFQWLHTCAEDLGPPIFLVILNTVVIHLWLADLKWLLWSDSSVFSRPIFLLLFFFSLPLPRNNPCVHFITWTYISHSKIRLLVLQTWNHVTGC